MLSCGTDWPSAATKVQLLITLTVSASQAVLVQAYSLLPASQALGVHEPLRACVRLGVGFSSVVSAEQTL